MSLKKSHKAISALMCLLLTGFFYYISVNLTRTTLAKMGTNACLYDPVLTFLTPASNYLASHELFKNILTAIDGIFIDFSICSLGLIYMLTAKSISFLPTVILFYGVRAIANNLVIFPVPSNYILTDPGVPSYFVDYRRLNDLYFSGHTGLFTIYLLDCFQNKRAKFNFVFAPFCFYTVFILLVEGIHYGNDIIIGFVCAAFLSRLIYRFRYFWNLLFFRFVVFVVSSCERLYGFMSSKVRQFQKKGTKQIEENTTCPAIVPSSLENDQASSDNLQLRN